MKNSLIYKSLHLCSVLLILLIAQGLFAQDKDNLKIDTFQWQASAWQISIAQLHSRSLNATILKVPHAAGDTIEFNIETFELWAPKGERDDSFDFFQGKNQYGDLIYGYENSGILFLTYFYKNKFYTIQPYEDQLNFFVRSSAQSQQNEGSFQCLNDGEETHVSLRSGGQSLICQEKSFSKIRMTLLLACTGEWSSYFDNKEKVKQSVVNHVLALNVLYTRELNLQFYLQLSEDLWYNQASTDAFDPNAASVVEQSKTFFNSQNKYDFDIGHVLHRLPGNRMEAEGVAYIGSACKSGQKGSGWTASGKPNDIGFNLRVLAHEVAHTLGAHHTYYGTSQNCENVAPSPGHGFEPGLGNSLMRYQGSCVDYADADPFADDLYFHSHSLNEMIKHLNFYRTCGSRMPRAEKPEVEIPYDFYVPLHTAFDLKAKGDLLYLYNWEQYDTKNEWPTDVESDGMLAGHFEDGPMYSSHAPGLLGHIRSLPSLGVQISQQETAGDVYAETPRNITMRLTTRTPENVSCQEVQIRVVDKPALEVLLPKDGSRIELDAESSNGRYRTASTIRWNSSSINNIYMPYNKVDILLSVDGGETFPYVLAEQVANSGFANVYFPYIETSRARVKISASINKNLYEIYAFNKYNFTIVKKQKKYLDVNFFGKGGKDSPVLNWEIPDVGNSVASVNLQYSFDDNEYQTIAYNLPTNKTNFIPQNMIQARNNSTTFYKLEIENEYGEIYYSDIVKVEPINDSESTFAVYPNPGNGKNISLDLPENRSTTGLVEVYNIQGQRLWQSDIGKDETSVNFSLNLKPGLYLISCQFDANRKILKYIVQ
ncbi:reprolysin-like metallopeptidase [Membranihabitans marinus]|uniref:reprolysin-like metallopeptidase n=1 Tax=Membranihabitans marinus TaxID=1227546 RepID=UPI001F272BDC|nr:M12 family metallo-peptidase [Membranihabitans marinus]